MKPSLLTTAALAATLLTGAGCAAPALTSPPRLAFASDVRPATSCRVTGEAQAIATHALADEIQVRASPGGGFAVAILDAVDPCLTVHVNRDGYPLGDRLETCPAASAPGAALASNGVETYVAHETWDEAGSRHLSVGYKTYDWPRSLFGVARPGRETVVEHPFLQSPDALPAGAEVERTEPKLAVAVRETFLLVWVEGDEVLAQPLVKAAEVGGAPLRVSPLDVIEAEHPAVAFAPTDSNVGDGLIAYAARTSTGFHVLATPVSCSAN